MIESELKYTQENVGEFVKYTIFRKNKSSGIYMICYKSSAYIVTHDGYLFIVDENTVREGSLDELRQIAEEKLVKTDD